MKTEIKQHTAKGTAFLLAILIPAIFLLSSCGGGSGENSTETDPVPEYIGSLTDYDIVCPEGASNAVKSACLKIRAAVMEASGKLLTYKEDFFREGDDNYTVGDREILVGNTNRQESAETAKGLGKFDYRIAVVGTKIAITAGSDESVGRAAEKFIEDFIVKDKMMIEKNYRTEYISGDNPRGAEPILKFAFDTSSERKTASDDGKYSARLINAQDIGGYVGNAFRFVKSSSGGAQFGDFSFAGLLAGKSSYTVSMWIMPYQSYHGVWQYRLFSAYGNGKNEILTISYSSPAIHVVLRNDDGSRETTVTFPYSLETVIPPFDAVNTNDGVWQFITLSVDLAGASVRLYVNGDEIQPSETVRADGFPTDSIKEVKNSVYSDIIAGDSKGKAMTFNGIIDEFQVFDRALDREEVHQLYTSYGKSEHPSITEDQAFIVEMLDKLGGGAAVLAGSANAVNNGYIVKADADDYSVKNILIDGEICIPASLAGTVFGSLPDVAAKTEGGKEYYPLKALCEKAGRKYIDRTKDSGLIVVLTDKSTVDPDNCDGYVKRLAEFCIETSFEPSNSVEQTRAPIFYINPSEKLFAYSPSITKIGDTLYASCDVSCYYTPTFRSDDNGKTWEQTGKVDGLWWATIFAHRGELYLVGRYTSGGYFGATGASYFGVTKSTDGGKTWSEINEKQGGVSYEGYGVHRAPTPVVELDGKLYTVFEVHTDSSGARREVVAFADADSDLIDPASWKFKNYLSDKRFPNEGNAVVGKDGNLWVVSRLTTNQGLLSKLSPDGSTLIPYNGTLNASYITIPGGQTKMTVRYDASTGKYLAIANVIGADKSMIHERNYSALISSDDLINWEIEELLLCDRSVINYYLSVSVHAFQYVDWIFDGDDILLVVREAMEDAANFHDSNYMTFYRIENYRQYLNG